MKQSMFNLKVMVGENSPDYIHNIIDNELKD